MDQPRHPPPGPPVHHQPLPTGQCTLARGEIDGIKDKTMRHQDLPHQVLWTKELCVDSPRKD
ncbi:uncharacterized protein N7473_005065 [Penicillium subrubescens]|uniref:uncharacterized protein n=1 Tax=Penicillium subrubescens TaxID=1316194 RepID=UPI0025454538|nr:uncharacterized protein N7473_005065 [Penicillium subrubescens]KAJ5900995.1 hypothetical protein N7473_005065 [Penicillium subrubescens]